MHTYWAVLKSVLTMVLIGAAIASCEHSSSIEENNSGLDQVVLIIDKCPNYSAYENPETGVYSGKDDDFEITAINSDLRKLAYKTNPTPTRDTVVFPTKGDVLELDHIYKFHRYLSFRAQKGDTILFTYDKDFPRATVLNRETSDQDINYELIRDEYLLADDENFDGNSNFNIHPVSTIKGYLAIKDQHKYKEIKDSIYTYALTKAKAELEKETVLLDSLLSNGLISESTKQYYLNKSRTLYEFNEFRFNDYVNKNTGDSEKRLNKWSIQEMVNEEVWAFGYYNRILDYIEREAYYSQVSWVNEVNRRYPDYREVYDSLKSNDLLSVNDIHLLLAKNMKLIIEHFTENDANVYIEKFISDVDNPALVQGVLDEYQYMLSPEIKEVVKEQFSVLDTPDSLLHLSLIDIESNQLDFSSLLADNKGHYVYVDFWASHCVPCYAAMPHSKALKASYRKKDVTFIYISIDKDYDEWVKGMRKAGIADEPLSYMVSESEMKNTLLQTYNVNEIPRYLLFDKTGSLMHLRAFGPSTPEIRELLDKYL
ncbi:TlpA family protein disulfide reductase [Roseivirga pacifica]|uniref:TlpA family protein disulfide reductase n=1 Tax=Roseivirga pacifica TaxID=1267423 RepID=UPI003BAF2D4A